MLRPVERLKMPLWTPKLHAANASRSMPHIQEKLDGWNAQLVVQPGGELQLFGRETLPSHELFKRFKYLITTLRVIAPARRLLDDYPVGLVISGEILALGGKATDVPTRLKLSRRKSLSDLQFTAFAIHHKHAPPLPEHQLAELKDAGFHVPRDFNQAFKSYDQLHPSNLRLLAKTWGIEGFVIKYFGLSDWFKYKITRSVDLVVTGVVPGEGKYSGKVGALRCSYQMNGESYEIASVGGMTDKDREQMTKMWNENRLFGRVCEVKFQELAVNRLRHPRFFRWREDKPAQECTWESVLWAAS